MRAPGPEALLFMVGFSSIATYMGIAEGVTILKISGAAVELIALLLSILIIGKSRKAINWSIAAPVLLLFLMPVGRILFESFWSFDTKTMSDGLILRTSHYQLPFVALAMTIVGQGRVTSFDRVLLNYATVAVPLSVVMLWYGIYVKGFHIGISYISFSSLLVPSAILIYFSSNPKAIFWGWLAIIILLIGSALIGSRSYNIVAILLAIIAFLRIRVPRKSDAILLIAISSIAISSYLLMDSQGTSGRVSSSVAVVEKYQYASLLNALSKAVDNLDISYLFFWEGNSRAEILVHAFSIFSLFDWTIGRGLLATYSSFVTRSTIEMGWAQETFRWGLIYTVPLMIILLKTRRGLLKRCRKNRSDLLYALAALIFVRLVDGFIYGMPNYDVYNLLVYFAVTLTCTKQVRAINPLGGGRPAYANA